MGKCQKCKCHNIFSRSPLNLQRVSFQSVHQNNFKVNMNSNKFNGWRIPTGRWGNASWLYVQALLRSWTKDYLNKSSCCSELDLNFRFQVLCPEPLIIIVTFFFHKIEKNSAFPARDLEACTHFWAKTDNTFAQLHIPVCITIRIHKHLTEIKLQ